MLSSNTHTRIEGERDERLGSQVGKLVVEDKVKIGEVIIG
jgi:hypothetical protein